MYDQRLEIRIQKMDHNGWNTVFHQDVEFELKRPNVIPFRNNLRKTLEDILNNTRDQMLHRYISMNYLRDHGTVLKFTFYKKGLTGYNDSFTHHIKMSEEGWRSGLVMFAQKIWEF